MGYGTTYSREPKKPTKEELSEKNSLVSCLCKEAGYNRENFEKTELEAKINLSCYWIKNPVLTLGENLEFPEPYSRDKILISSKANHSCYAFVDKKTGVLKYAFTKVEREGKVKIKIKEKAEQIKKDNIILLKRNEKHLENLIAIEVNKYITEIARQSNLPLEYIGTFLKQSKEAFVFNPTSGRIFVIGTNICKIESNPNQLYQLEIEYYGQINGFSSTKEVEQELAELTGEILRNLPKGHKGENSTLTKFDWLVQNLKK